MSGNVIYSFDWDLFEDLTTNPKSKLPAKIAEKVVPLKGKKSDGLLGTLPESKPEAAKVISKLFLEPEWFVGQDVEEAKLRQELLIKLLFDTKLKSIGLKAGPPQYGAVAFDLAPLLSGLAELDLPRMKGSGEAYFKYRKSLPKKQNVFSRFGSRPYRHGEWKETRTQFMEFEETFRRPPHSIHSKSEVKEMLSNLEASMLQYKDVKNEDLAEMFNDMHVDLKIAADNDAGIFVDNDY